MKKIILMIFSCLLAFSSMEARIDLPKPDRSHASLSDYYKQLQEEIALQEVRIAKLMEQINSKTSVPSYVTTINLQTAVTMLDVKKTLYANFYGTPSILYAEIREKLLAIMKKDIITQHDLAELQYLVNVYKG